MDSKLMIHDFQVNVTICLMNDP